MPPATRSFQLEVLPGVLAVCRLGAEDSPPEWAQASGFLSMTRTTDELSVVCLEAVVPPEVRCERGWRCLRVEGPLDFSEVGVLAALTSVLAAAGVSLFAISTFDTDYLLVGETDLERAVSSLREAGHRVTEGL